MKNRKLISLLGVILIFSSTLFLFNCKEEKPDTPTPPPIPIIAPETYTQKVLIEYATSASITFCAEVVPNFLNKFEEKFGANTVYSVAFHRTDNMFNRGIDTFHTLFSDGGLPTGMVNRIGAKCESRQNWEARIIDVRGQNAKCGLSIDASKNTAEIYTIKIKLGIGKLSIPADANHYLIAYMIKKERSGTGSGWDQANNYNDLVGHPCYQKGNPIVGYIHKNVFIKSLGQQKGLLIPSKSLIKGTLTEFNYDIDMRGLIPSEYEIVAFVFKTDNIPLIPVIENVQKVEVGQNKAFD